MRRDYRLGLLGGADPAFELGVEAERRARPLPGGTDHGALARATVRCLTARSCTKAASLAAFQRPTWQVYERALR